MALQHIRVVERDAISTFMWNGLRRFHHIPTVAAEIIERHSVPKAFAADVGKQASQIRHCLMQAREYREAASAVSLITKPLLLYYSVMSLALAQILLKSDGNSSLDKARGQHAHHGLIFSPGGYAKSQYKLSEVAAELRARPMIAADGQRKGTFELWQRTSREDPIGGYIARRQDDGTRTEFAGLMGASSDRFGTLPEGGISLLECFEALPGMFGAIGLDDFSSHIVRGRVSVEVLESGRSILKFIIHPSQQNLIDRIADRILISPKDVNLVTVSFINDSIMFYITQDYGMNVNFSIPHCTTWSTDEIRFLPPDSTLNEFGLLYVGLYMLGNYARYFPDRWVADVDVGSPLAQAAEVFLHMAEWRMALLTYSDFSGSYCVPSA